MLGVEETLELLAKAKAGDDYAKETLLTENTPLIKSVIRRYKNKGIEYDDLYQLGCVGFVKAIRNFDTTFNVKFSTYAVPMIAGEIKRFLRDDGVIKVSRSIKQSCQLMKKYINERLMETGESPKIEEIAEHFGVDPQEVVFTLESSYMPMSINETYNDDENNSSLEERFSDDLSTDNMVDKLVLRDMISKLSAKEKQVIIMRYYLDKTQSEIASVLGVSQVQISRIENKVLEYLKKNMN